jgi:hypothetical protein
LFVDFCDNNTQTVLRYAIKGAPDGRLLLEEIYYAIEQRYHVPVSSSTRPLTGYGAFTDTRTLKLHLPDGRYAGVNQAFSPPS